jgi:ADP-heptose:LPS heptosyltransferase
VVLTLPVAGVLRSLYPEARIIFLGRSYTEEVIKACEYVDEFLNWDQLRQLPEEEAALLLAHTKADTIIHVFPHPVIAKIARRAGIKMRIGTTNRLYHWFTCNRLVRLSRRNSQYHEAQLNLLLLSPLGAKELYTLKEIAGLYGLTRLSPLPSPVASLLDPDKFNLILHPKSRGHGREWGLDNFIGLVELLPRDRFTLFVSGGAEEGKLLRPLLDKYPFLTDLTGTLTLPQFMTFISRADGLLASGTGPLHLAAALGINALGIFPPIRPIHPGRWAPIGPRAKVFVNEKNCAACRLTADCTCMREIRPQQLSNYLLSLQPIHDEHPANPPAEN